MTTKAIIADYSDPNQGNDIIHLLSEYASDPMGGGEPLSDYVRDNLLSSLASVPGAFSILCYIESVPVGLANCFEGFSTFKCRPLINIHDIVVTHDHRGMGVSQIMLEKIESVAIKRQCCKITLEVLQGNHNAISAYRKFGFTPYELNQEFGQAMFWEKQIKY